jgi:hypothetical protein
VSLAENYLQHLEDAAESESAAEKRKPRAWNPKRLGALPEMRVQPPLVDHELNHAAEQLHVILTQDAFDALVSAAADEGVRDAVARLLEALAKARSSK